MAFTYNKSAIQQTYKRKNGLAMSLKTFSYA